MLENLICSIYAMHKYQMIFCSLIGVMLWIICSVVIPNKIFKCINFVLSILGLFFVFYITLIRRTQNEYYMLLIPFSSLKGENVSEEYYRTMLLNCLLFIPFSLGLAGVLPNKIKIGKRMIIVVITGFLLSLSVEILQYVFSLGNTEIDDVIMNTLGSFIAALALLLQNKLYELKNKKLKAVD